MIEYLGDDGVFRELTSEEYAQLEKMREKNGMIRITEVPRDVIRRVGATYDRASSEAEIAKIEKMLEERWRKGLYEYEQIPYDLRRFDDDCTDDHGEE